MSENKLNSRLGLYVLPTYKQGMLLLDGNKILAYLPSSKRLESNLYTNPRDIFSILLISLPHVPESIVKKAINRYDIEIELALISSIASLDTPLLKKSSEIKMYLEVLINDMKKHK